VWANSRLQNADQDLKVLRITEKHREMPRSEEPTEDHLLEPSV